MDEDEVRAQRERMAFALGYLGSAVRHVIARDDIPDEVRGQLQRALDRCRDEVGFDV